MKTPKGFNLTRAKIRPDGKLQVSYSTNESTFDGETPKHFVSNDLRESFDALKYALISSHLLNWPALQFHEDLFTTPSESGAFKSLKGHLEKCRQEINEAIEVTGFSHFGEEGNRGCVVTGKLKVKGRVLGISSCKMLFKGDTFGFEQQLDTDVDNAINEVRLYLFEGKSGEAPQSDKDQMKMFEDGVEDEPEVKTIKPRKNQRG